MNLLLAQAMVVLELLAPDQMPEVGIEALEAGADSNALRMLAGLTQAEIDEAPGLFERALKELGFPLLNRSAAARIYTIAISERIINGEISPRLGANRIWDASIRVGDPEFHDLDTFIYAAGELQDRPEDQSFFGREIVKEARSWVLKSRDPLE